MKICMSIILVIFFSFLYFMFISSTKQSSEINNSHYIDPLKPTVIVATPPDGWLGEPEVTARLMLTAKKIGWNVLSEYQIESIPLKELKNIFGIYVSGYVTNLDYPLYNRLPKSIPLFEIDFIVEKKASQDPEGYFNNKIRPKQVKAILGTSLQSIDCFINNNIQEQGLNFIMTWYPTVQSTHYTPNPTPKKLMYYGTKCPHDIRSNLKKYVQLWQQLDKTEYFVVYGFKFAWENMKKYQGYIPADGRSFVQTINKHGICLVMHRDTHLKAGAPSGRIFEAAAAAAVIISDKHPFVEKEFKNSVLYVDQTRDDLFEQIDTHMRWIKENPEAAKTKALQAHKIFLEKFTLEEQLIRLYENFKTIKLNT